MMKCLFGCGVYAAFRGHTEHLNFCCEHISIGIYPKQFESQQLAGLHYVSIDTFGNDKSNKMGVYSPYVCDTSTRKAAMDREESPKVTRASKIQRTLLAKTRKANQGSN